MIEITSYFVFISNFHFAKLSFPLFTFTFPLAVLEAAMQIIVLYMNAMQMSGRSRVFHSMFPLLIKSKVRITNLIIYFMNNSANFLRF